MNLRTKEVMDYVTAVMNVKAEEIVQQLASVSVVMNVHSLKKICALLMKPKISLDPINVH